MRPYAAIVPVPNPITPTRRAELLFWEWPADNWVGNQHVKFFLARYAVDGTVFALGKPDAHQER